MLMDWQVSSPIFEPISLTLLNAACVLAPNHAVEKDDYVRTIMEARVCVTPAPVRRS